jgi:hypothetical protein
MTKLIYEISTSIWFYYKEICYDERSHESKNILNVHDYEEEEEGAEEEEMKMKKKKKKMMMMMVMMTK